MPLHFDDADISSEIEGIRSVLIVPCRMCPAVSIAVQEKEPFLQLWKSWFRSQPFERYLTALQKRLMEDGIDSEVFGCTMHYQWFMCMWDSRIRKRLQSSARRHGAVVVMRCNSATVTVRNAVESFDCRVIEGMKVGGIMNAKLSVRWPGEIRFKDCRTVSLLQKGT
jgi:glutamate racemase